MSHIAAPSSIATGKILVNNASFARHLRVANPSPQTVCA